MMPQHRPLRLTAVLTHPVQYFAPFARRIAVQPEVDLTVLYASAPTPEQQGVGFGQAFSWDVPLTDGYRCRIVRPSRSADRFDSESFRGLDVPEIGAALRATRPDVALVTGWYSLTLVRALLACRRAGIPVLYRGDTHLESGPRGWKRPLWVVKNRVLLRLFSGYLSVGTRTRNYLRQSGIDASRIFDCPHAVDNEFFDAQAREWRQPDVRTRARAELGIAPDAPVVLFAGKLQTKKRPLDVIRAAARLPPPGVTVLFAGAGELEANLRSEADRLRVQCRFLGFLNQSQIGRAYAIADCLALPSDSTDTWGLVVNEALATGLPCVVSDRVGCAIDLIDVHRSGTVFPFGDIDSLARGIARFCEPGLDRNETERACRRQVEAFSLEASTRGLVKACEHVIDGSPSAPQTPTARVLACCGGMVLIGGAERMAFAGLRALSRAGAEVHCVVNSWENFRVVREAAALGATWSIGRYRATLARRAVSVRQMVQIVSDVVRTSGGLLVDASGFRPTTVLIADITTVIRNFPALVLLRIAGTRVLFLLQNVPAPGRFYRALWRGPISLATSRFICCSETVRQALTAHGVPESRTGIIYNVAPQHVTTRTPQRRDPNRILFAGQVIPEKGLDLLLDAVALLIKRHEAVCLDVAGTVEGWTAPGYVAFRDRVLARARAPDLAGRVRFLGWIDDVPDRLAEVAVHCCPSRPEMLEGLPLVVLEAKRAGTPSVAFDLGPFRELIKHGADGWLAHDLTAEALAEGLSYFLASSAGRAAEISSRVTASYERFGLDTFEAAWHREVLDRIPASEHRADRTVVASAAMQHKPDLSA